MNRSRLLSVVAVIASAVVLIGASSGQASRFSTSSRTFRETFRDLTFEASGSFTISCPVTIEGSLHSSTIAKVEEAAIGKVSSARANEAACTGGGATINSEVLPWEVLYEGFAGTLPNITEMRRIYRGMRITLTIKTRPRRVDCVYASTTNQEPINVSLSLQMGRITQVAFNGMVVPVVGNSLDCPTLGIVLQGTAPAPTPQGGTSMISVRLI